MTLVLGIAVIGVAVVAVVRRVEVRLVLLVAAVLLGCLGGHPEAVVQKFFSGLTSAEFVVPLCSAMGFAYVLRHTECDQHLVHLLVEPLRRAKPLLVPGAVLVGFLVNIPIISQTSTAVAIGSVLIPLLVAARVRPETAGAALLLGASIGGELLNQGAPEFRTIAAETSKLGLPAPTGSQLVQSMLPLDLLHLALATGLFWFLSLRADARAGTDDGPAQPQEPSEAFRVNPFKAAVPLLPLVLLFVVSEPFRLVQVPHEWLVGENEAVSFLAQAARDAKQTAFARAAEEAFNSRLIGAAMLVGAVVAALTGRRQALGAAGAFFEGAGYAVTHIVSLIIVAGCFGEGVKQIGLTAVVEAFVRTAPALLVPLSAALTLGFGFISGSGIAATQSLFSIFSRSAQTVGMPPETLGLVVALAAAAGRTMSPVAAVVLMCASLTGASPVALARRVAPPLLVGLVAVVVVVMLRGVR